jgi:uncharacterized protein (TIGR03067 family)
VVVLLVVSAAAVAAPVPKALNKKVVYDGRWRVIELNANGLDVTDLNPWVWEINREELVISNHTNGKLTPNDPNTITTLVREPGYGPREVDYVCDRGNQKLVFKGLVSVTDDVLTICFADPDKERPAEAKVGKTVHYLRFKRFADK